MSVVNEDWDEEIHSVRSHYDTIFTWDYEKGQRPKLDKLYEKAKKTQWNGQTDLPWDTDVDQEKLVVANAVQNGGLGRRPRRHRHPVRRSGARRSGSSSASRARTGRSRSSCTGSRERSSARPRSSSRSPGSMPSTTPQPR